MELLTPALEAHFFPTVEEASRLSISCYRADYSASRIACAVEDCDAHLINLNVTDRLTPEGEIIIDLRINHRNASSVARSLERYGYTVIQTSSEDGDLHQEVAAGRVAQLMAQLNV